MSGSPLWIAAEKAMRDHADKHGVQSALSALSDMMFKFAKEAREQNREAFPQRRAQDDPWQWGGG